MSEHTPDIMDYEARCEDLERVNAKLLAALEALLAGADVCTFEDGACWTMAARVDKDNSAYEQAQEAVREAKA